MLSGVYGLKLVAQDGPSAIAAVAIGAGLVLGVLFVRRQRQLAHPLIDLDLFRAPTFNATVVTLTLNSAVMFAASFFTAQYLQLVLGLSPAQAGLWTVPGVLAVLASSQLAPRLLRWGTPTALMVAGSLVCAVGFAVLTQAPAAGLPVVVGGSVLIALGVGPIATLANAAIVGAAHPNAPGRRRPSRRAASTSAGPSGWPSSAAWPSPSTARRWWAFRPRGSRRMPSRPRAARWAARWRRPATSPPEPAVCCCRPPAARSATATWRSR